MENIQFICPHCRSSVEVPTAYQGHQVQCHACSQEISIPFISTRNESRDTVNQGSNTKQVVGIIGSIALTMGVFAPLITLPIIGSLDYFQNGKGDGVFVLGLGLVSLLFVLLRWHSFLWVSGIGSIGIIGYSFFNIVLRIEEAKEGLRSELADNSFRGLAEVAVESIKLSWGWGLLFAGAVMVIASAAIPDRR